MKKTCPECGCPINNNASSCPDCGYLFPKRNKQKLLILSVCLCILLCIVIVSSIIYSKYQASKNAFEEATQLKQDYQFEEAIAAYNLVQTWDKNYSAAQTAINICKSEITKYEKIIVAFDAVRDKYGIKSNDLRAIFKHDNVEGYLFDTGTMGYAAVKTIPNNTKAMEGYYQSSYHSGSNLYVLQYKANFMVNGWLTSTTNDIRQITSDTTFEIETVLSTKLDVNSFKKVYDSHNQ